MEEKYIVALEIGSSKIKGAVGTVDTAGALSVKSVEEEKLSDGVRYGCIRNVVETANAIRSVISRLEQREAQRKVTGVYVSVGGRSLNSQAIEVERRFATETEITMEMISDIINDALNQPLHERSVVCVTPREFRVDKAPRTRAVGMMGSHISARLNLISCRNQLMRNLHNVLNERLQLKVQDVFVRQLAEADLVLFSEEKRLGCMLVDFGAETTAVSIYKNGVLEYLTTIPMGSRNITRDITALNHLEERAEELKIMGGNALPTTEQNVVYSNAAADYSQINNYVAARAGEIIANINEQLKYAGFNAEKLPGGIIIVGKGAKLNGFNQRLENMTGMKVRVGAPTTRIRINDGRIQSADAVDVIAILSAAAKNNPVECMTRPAPVFTESPRPADPQTIYTTKTQTAQQTQTTQTSQQTTTSPAAAGTPRQSAPAAATEPVRTPKTTPVTPQAPKIEYEVEDEPASTRPQEKSGFRRAWGGLVDRVAKLMTEPIEDDEDDDDK